MSSAVARGKEKETENNKMRANLKFVYNYLDCTIRYMVLGILYYHRGLLLTFYNVLLRNASTIQVFEGSQTRASRENLHRDGKNMQTPRTENPSPGMNPEPSGCELTAPYWTRVLPSRCSMREIRGNFLEPMKAHKKI